MKFHSKHVESIPTRKKSIPHQCLQYYVFQIRKQDLTQITNFSSIYKIITFLKHLRFPEFWHQNMAELRTSPKNIRLIIKNTSLQLIGGQLKTMCTQMGYSIGVLIRVLKKKRTIFSRLLTIFSITKSISNQNCQKSLGFRDRQKCIKT